MQHPAAPVHGSTRTSEAGSSEIGAEYASGADLHGCSNLLNGHEAGYNEMVASELSAEIKAAIVKQVEFYCSDANLPSDKKLLRQIRKDPEGYVPVKLFANFRKVRALTRDVACITEALRTSTELTLSADGSRVRRRAPLPDFDIEEIQRRTIVVEQLPLASTIEGVTELFSQYGRVKLVRICTKESKGKLPVWLTGAVGAVGLHNSSGGGSLSDRPHAYVEYESEENAIMAVAAMHDSEGWRPHGVQVRHLVFPCSDSPQRLACLSQRDRDRMSSSSRNMSLRNSRDSSPGIPAELAASNSRVGGGVHGAGATQHSSPSTSQGGSMRAHEQAAPMLMSHRGWTAPGAPHSQTHGLSIPPRAPQSISAGGGSLSTPASDAGRPQAMGNPAKGGVYVPPARRSAELQHAHAHGTPPGQRRSDSGRAAASRVSAPDMVRSSSLEAVRTQADGEIYVAVASPPSSNAAPAPGQALHICSAGGCVCDSSSRYSCNGTASTYTSGEALHAKPPVLHQGIKNGQMVEDVASFIDHIISEAATFQAQHSCDKNTPPSEGTVPASHHSAPETNNAGAVTANTGDAGDAHEAADCISSASRTLPLPGIGVMPQSLMVANLARASNAASHALSALQRPCVMGSASDTQAAHQATSHQASPGSQASAPACREQSQDEDDEEVQRFRQALQAASVAHPGQAQAQAHASRAKAAALATRPPRPGASVPGCRTSCSPLGPVPEADVDAATREDCLDASVEMEEGSGAEEGSGSEGAGMRQTGTDGGDVARRRRRRRRGSRSGARSRRASEAGLTSAESLGAQPASAPMSRRGSSSEAGSSLRGPTSGTGSTMPCLPLHMVTEPGHGERSGMVRDVQQRSNKKEYASWAAATPHFRAPAAGAAGGQYGTAGRGVLPSATLPKAAPGRPFLSEGGCVLETFSALPPAQHVQIAAGPDGTRGFVGCGRGKQVPPRNA